MKFDVIILALTKVRSARGNPIDTLTAKLAGLEFGVLLENYA